MKTSQKHPKYTKWLNAEDMHEASKEWLSELEFIKDEHLFFEDLVTTYTLQLTETGHFAKGRELIDILYQSQKQNHELIEAIKVHENDLQIMVDGINQIREEQGYVKEHLELIKMINTFLKDYKQLKLQLFEMIKTIKKEEKQKHRIANQ